MNASGQTDLNATKNLRISQKHPSLHLCLSKDMVWLYESAKKTSTAECSPLLRIVYRLLSAAKNPVMPSWIRETALLRLIFGIPFLESPKADPASVALSGRLWTLSAHLAAVLIHRIHDSESAFAQSREHARQIRAAGPAGADDKPSDTEDGYSDIAPDHEHCLTALAEMEKDGFYSPSTSRPEHSPPCE
jgi:hypothetical protein